MIDTTNQIESSIYFTNRTYVNNTTIFGSCVTQIELKLLTFVVS